MIAARRIRRIQRWARIANENRTMICCPHFSDGADSCVHEDGERIVERLDNADRLFAAELAWLCEYATDLERVTESLDSFANNIQLDIQAIRHRGNS